MITSLIKDEVSKRYHKYSKSISSKRLAELINSQLDLKNEVFYADNKMSCTDGSRKRGVFIEWGDFCRMVGTSKKQNGLNVQGLEIKKEGKDD